MTNFRIYLCNLTRIGTKQNKKKNKKKTRNFLRPTRMEKREKERKIDGLPKFMFDIRGFYA